MTVAALETTIFSRTGIQGIEDDFNNGKTKPRFKLIFGNVSLVRLTADPDE